MSIEYATGKFELSIQTFQSAQKFIRNISIFLLIAIALGLFLNWKIKSSGLLETLDSIALGVFLGLSALISLYQNLLENIYRSRGQFAIGVILTTSARLFEWAGIIIAATIFSSTPTQAAAVALAARVGFLISMLWKTRKTTRYFIFGNLPKLPNKNFQTLFCQAGVQFTFTASSAISIQGVTIAIGSILGPIILAEFTAMRTLARAPIQLFSMLSRAIWPALTIYLAKRDLVGCDNLIRKSLIYGIYFSIATFVAFLFLGEKFFIFWTNQNLRFHPDVFFVLVAATIVSTLAQTFYVAIAAGERAARFSIFLLAIYLTLLLIIFMQQVTSARVIVFEILLAEITTGALCAFTWKKLRGEYERS